MSVSSGIVEWTHEPIPPKAASKSDRVVEMLKEDLSTADIIKKTGVSKGLISQIKKRLAATEV
jgi:hypothetical protein